MTLSANHIFNACGIPICPLVYSCTVFYELEQSCIHLYILVYLCVLLNTLALPCKLLYNHVHCCIPVCTPVYVCTHLCSCKLCIFLYMCSCICYVHFRTHFVSINFTSLSKNISGQWELFRTTVTQKLSAAFRASSFSQQLFTYVIMICYKSIRSHLYVRFLAWLSHKICPHASKTLYIFIIGFLNKCLLSLLLFCFIDALDGIRINEMNKRRGNYFISNQNPLLSNTREAIYTTHIY